MHTETRRDVLSWPTEEQFSSTKLPTFQNRHRPSCFGCFRREDIPLLAEHFLRKAAKDGQENMGFSKDALDIMVAYDWPGNVRELQSANLERGLTEKEEKA